MSNPHKKKPRELYRGFQENANASLSLYTRFSNLACAPRLSWAIVKFPFFRFLRVESMSGEERWAGYYTKQAKHYVSLSPLPFFCESFTRHLQSDEGEVNGLCLFYFLFPTQLFFLVFSQKSTATVIYGRLFDIF